MKQKLPQSFLNAPLAHRALHDVSDGRPENSRAAIQAAIDHGYGIEIDVQLSADNKAMVFHDFALERLAEATGPIRQRSAAGLNAVRLIGGSEGIPTLPEVLNLVGGRVPLLIEIKDQDGAMGPSIGPLEDAVAAALDGYVGPIGLMSFNPHSVAHFAKHAPQWPRGLTTSAFNPKSWPLPEDTCTHLRMISDYDRVGATFISHEAADLDSDRVRDLKAEGANVLCWTIKSPEEEAKARAVAQNVTFEGYLPTVSA